MSLSLDTLYRIAFPSKPLTDGIEVQQEDLPDGSAGHFVLELIAGVDRSVRKCRLQGVNNNSLALCSNGEYCLNDAPVLEGFETVRVSDVLETIPDVSMTTVTSPELENAQDWLVPSAPGMVQITLFMTLISYNETVMPCDDQQQEFAVAVDSVPPKTVGAFPMVFEFPDHSGPGKTGKKVKIIWKKDT
jgi:hypothetical protein